MKPGIKIAFYRKEDWKKLLEIIDDADSMHDSWNEWNKAFHKAKKEFISQGFEVLKIEVNLDELKKYCLIRGIRNDGKARSQFVQSK